MKPNFEAMTNDELRTYALEHRNDDDDLEALRVLFSRRQLSSPGRKFYPPKTQAEEQEQFELFKQLVAQKETKKTLDN
jgi:hypothetical protein